MRAHELGIVDALADGYTELIDTAVARVHGLRGQRQPIHDGALALPSLASEPTARGPPAQRHRRH